MASLAFNAVYVIPNANHLIAKNGDVHLVWFETRTEPESLVKGEPMKDNGLSRGWWVVLALALTLFGLWNWHLSLISGQLEDIKHAIIAEGVCSDGYMPFKHFQNMGLVVHNNTDSDIEITQWSPGDNVGLTLFLAAGEGQIVSPVVTGVDPNNPNCVSLDVGFKANRRLMVNGMWLDDWLERSDLLASTDTRAQKDFVWHDSHCLYTHQA